MLGLILILISVLLYSILSPIKSFHIKILNQSSFLDKKRLFSWQWVENADSLYKLCNILMAMGQAYQICKAKLSSNETKLGHRSHNISTALKKTIQCSPKWSSCACLGFCRTKLTANIDGIFLSFLCYLISSYFCHIYLSPLTGCP